MRGTLALSLITLSADVLLGSEPAPFLALEMKPSIADALEKNIAGDPAKANETQRTHANLVSSRKIKLVHRLTIDPTAAERQWRQGPENRRTIKMFPGWNEQSGMEMTWAPLDQGLECFAKLIEPDGASVRVHEFKTEAKSVPFLYARWDNRGEESVVLFSRALDAPVADLFLFKALRYRFPVVEEVQDFMKRVEMAGRGKEAEALSFLRSKANQVQGVTVVALHGKNARLADRQPVDFQVADDEWKHEDDGFKLRLRPRTEDGRAGFGFRFESSRPKANKREHVAGNRVPDFEFVSVSEEVAELGTWFFPVDMPGAENDLLAVVVRPLGG
ncbi:MAG: hypothetical protein AAGJ79_05460 [Verrucomicrobiota bacterium]